MGMFNKEVPDDIYSWIANDVLHDISIDRNFIKELTFKILYGASMNTIKKDLDWLYDIEDIVNRIKSNMGYQELALKIKFFTKFLFLIKLLNCLNLFDFNPINSAGIMPTSERTEYLPPIKLL